MEPITQDLTQVTGGSWEDVVNLGKAAVNGGVNTLNFFHDHPVTVGPFGLGVGGDRVQKPFQNDPLSHLGEVKGHAVPAKPAAHRK